MNIKNIEYIKEELKEMNKKQVLIVNSIIGVLAVAGMICSVVSLARIKSLKEDYNEEIGNYNETLMEYEDRITELEQTDDTFWSMWEDQITIDNAIGDLLGIN